MTKYKVAGYVKLAKLWEKNKDKAIIYHREYYFNLLNNSEKFKLINVYIDITGQKSILNRPQMLELLKDCYLGKVNCIFTQTKGYLAANSKEFSYLIKYLFELNNQIEIITEDENYNINTINNKDNQRDALYKMANDMIDYNIKDFSQWKRKIESYISQESENNYEL